MGTILRNTVLTAGALLLCAGGTAGADTLFEAKVPFPFVVNGRTLPAGKAIHLVAISGYGRDEDRLRASEAGFVTHLLKPVEFEALRRALAGLPATPR
jgi:hypothetical protein